MDEQSVNTAGKELLDATQEAVIGAADNVETILKAPLRNWGRTRSLYLSPEFWVGMAFVMVAVGLFIPLKKGFVRHFWGNILPKRPDVSPMPRILKPRRGSCWRLMREKLRKESMTKPLRW